MKAKWIFIVVALLIAAGYAGWRAGKSGLGAGTANNDGGSRKVAFYQSPMHPWIKSEEPGNCTICGMALTPVYEGQKGFEVASDVVTLSRNTINVIHVATVPVTRTNLTRGLAAVGSAENDERQRRVISAYVEGRIDELRVTFPGQVVKQGELLARLYSPALLTAEREYLSLLDAPGEGESRGLTEDRTRLREAAEQRLRRLGMSPEQIAALGSKATTNSVTDIHAPFTGTVLERMAYEGQYVAAGEKLFTIGDYSRLWFQFDIYERDLAWIKPGTIARITTSSNPGKVYEAPVSFVEPSINPETRSARVRVEVENPLIGAPNGELRHELFNRVYAEAAFILSVSNVLAVPRTAVVSARAEPLVYVDLGGGNYQQRKVQLGFRGEELVEIVEGLEEGEKVVTTGSMLIDSQAQLNQQAVGPEETSAATPQADARTKGPPINLTAEQTTFLREIVDGAAKAADGLAADRVTEFNSAAPQLAERLAHAEHIFPAEHAWMGGLKKLGGAGKLKPTNDLREARAQFIAFSNALSELALHAHDSEPFKATHVYKCPMTDRSMAGAPKNGFWIQLSGPVRNPFFGAEMLDCGAEVKP
ncbi:MAG TPA: efflux RND transporter periplasmic adaptor subunit [Methylomirabilota bacterium]|nr:efflux RND transporter periplasmic adaptor subunit [Methylomirabilota bacterium]